MAGDTHADIGHVNMLSSVAVDEECAFVVQLGDFGMWDHTPSGVDFLDTIESLAANTGIPWYWIGGNHENYDRIDQFVQANPNPGPFVQIRPGIYYIQRGAAWTWDGVAFLAMGGAYSIDKGSRTPGRSWWPQELITDDDVKIAIESGTWLEPDVLLVHEAPEGAPIDELARIQINKKSEETCHDQRRKVAEVVKHTNPSLIFHGHYHTRLSYLLEYTDADYKYRAAQVEALACNGMRDSWMVLDTERYKWKSS